MKTDVVYTVGQEAGAEAPRGSLRSGAMNLWVAQVSRRGTRLLFLLVAARWLGPTNFGIYTLLLTVTEMVAIVTGAGFGDYVTRELARVPETAHQVSSRITQLRWVYSAAVGLLMLGVLRLLGYPRSILLMATFMALSLFPRAVQETCQGALRAAERFRWYAASEVVQGTSLLVIGVVLLQKFGLAGAVFAELAALVVAAAFSLLPALRSFPHRSGAAVPSWSEIVRRTLPFNLYPLVVQVYDRVDVILLSKLASNTAVGLYGFPYKIYASLQILPYGIFGTLLPRLSRSDWKSETQQSMGKILELLYVVSLSIVLLTTIFAGPGIRLLLGDAYQGSALALKILMWASVPMFLNYGFNTVLLANRREKVFIITATVSMIVNVVGNIVLIPRYSYKAAAAVTVLTEGVLLVQNLYWVHKKLGRTLLPTQMFGTTVCFVATWALAFAGPRYLPLYVAETGALLIFGSYVFAIRKSFARSF